MAAPFCYLGWPEREPAKRPERIRNPEAIGNMGTKSKQFIPWELATMNPSKPNKIKESHNFLVLPKEVGGRRRRSGRRVGAPFAFGSRMTRPPTNS